MATELQEKRKAGSRDGYTMADYAEIINGKTPLPNFEPMEHAKFLNAIAAHSMRVVRGNALKPDEHAGQYASWATFFLTSNSMGPLGGGGMVVIYGSRGPVCGEFAICKHEKVEGAGANHSRGWHPGHCGKCGIDMTVDSGD